MTKTFLITLLLTTRLLAAERLTNDDVINLTKAQLSSGVIITAINNSEPSFDTSVAGLIALRKAGVANEVLSAMLTATTPTSALAASDPTVVRFEFTRVLHRDGLRGYLGTLHGYDDRLVFTPRRDSWATYALDVPWGSITSMCFEEGPIRGDLFLTTTGRSQRVRLSTDSDKIQPLREHVTQLTNRSVPECE